MKIPEYILIVASSGRMLAQAAKKAGLKPLVIDLFADLDTQYYAEAFVQVSSLAKKQLTSAVDYFIKQYAVAHIIYGSGFEYYPESLHYLAGRLLVLGNSPDTFAKLHDKPGFFSSLKRLNIPHPEVCFTAPAYADNWLVKPMQGQGGLGIKYYHPQDFIEPADYWQKYQTGKQYSVLFLADGTELQVIGFNRQWVISLSESREFIFSGIINSCGLLDKQKQQITDWLKKLIPEFGLKGLNSLDFIQAGGVSLVLEINPRPSASMQLYDADLLTRHIKASQGELTTYCGHTGYTGYQIVYAVQDVTIPDGFEWPEGCMDLSKSGTVCHTGQPVCSIITHQDQAHSVMNELLIKQLNLNKRFSTHYGIQS
ncbi:ATP-grasp domain-containing protein [Methylobacter sp. S3L5C]|uniref:ATP-grasp domain-containing protein n=1 Tax=Methylobacter sp. S3L5C TaxID=2839024 RepID=UPI001FAD1F40|nr:ATP-grasp domain-containing protein [Methylobacter sp. S3L5C]UOA10358.1 ATP-grasp domain-containing protein [Methylobacter sp. S3L5C]